MEIDITGLQYEEEPDSDNEEEMSTKMKQPEMFDNYANIAPDNQQMIPVQQPPSLTPSIDRSRLILIMKFYLLEFPKKLEEFHTTDFESMTEEELTKLREVFDYIIGSRSNIRGSQVMFMEGVGLLEHCLANYTPIRAEGLKKLCDDKEMREDIAHLCLKHMALIKTEPHQRIAFKLFSNLLVVHQINSAKATNPDLSGVNKVNEKYKGL